MTSSIPLTDRIRVLVDDPEACLKGTPMIPLHRHTIRQLLDEIDRLKHLVELADACDAEWYDNASGFGIAYRKARSGV